jgi:hypothetical protein
MILREMGAFAYQGGLIFEGELMHKGGRNMAFAEVFAHPPRSSHEVLQPETYINGEKLPPIRIPDTKKLLSDQYDVYDSGGIGEVDVRALLKQFGERKIADDLSSAWQGGAYVTFRRKDKDKDKGKDKNTDQDKDKAVADTPVSTGDLAVLYISRWKTAQAADRFARFYSGAVSQRYRSAAVQEVQACSGGNCPLSMAEFLTEEGPVIVERRQGNSVIVCESFDTATSAKLRAARTNYEERGACPVSSTGRNRIAPLQHPGVQRLRTRYRRTDRTRHETTDCPLAWLFSRFEPEATSITPILPGRPVRGAPDPR